MVPYLVTTIFSIFYYTCFTASVATTVASASHVPCSFHVAILALWFVTCDLFSVYNFAIFGLKDVGGHRDVFDHGCS